MKVARHSIYLTDRTEQLLTKYKGTVCTEPGQKLDLSPLIGRALEEHFIHAEIASRPEGHERTSLFGVESAISSLLAARQAMVRQIAAKDHRLHGQMDVFKQPGKDTQ